MGPDEPYIKAKVVGWSFLQATRPTFVYRRCSCSYYTTLTLSHPWAPVVELDDDLDGGRNGDDLICFSPIHLEGAEIIGQREGRCPKIGVAVAEED